MSTHGKDENSGGDGSRIEGDPLESAILYVGRNARTTGEESFRIRRAAAIAQRAALVTWAKNRGLILSPTSWKEKATAGGSEHDIWEEFPEYWKVTRPDAFGWTVIPGLKGIPVITEATPLEYLERLGNSVKFFGDSVLLRGVAETDYGVQIATSQIFIKGPFPSKESVAADLLTRGYIPLSSFFIGAERNSTFYHVEENIAIFDASTDNFILSNGVPVPIDLIIQIPGRKLRAQLLRLLGFP